MATSVAKKPVQQELFAGEYRAPAMPRVAEVPPSIGTLPPDVYVAWRVLRARGPQTSEKLEKWLLRERDWAHARAERIIKAVATCGYVDVDESGVMTAKETR